MNVNVSTEQTIELREITFCKYELITINKQIRLTFPQLLQLRKNVNHLTEAESLFEIIETENFVLLFVADKQHLIYLDIPQLLELKSAVDSFFTSVNSVLI